MAGWIGGFVKVDDTRGDVGFQVALEGCAAARDGREVPGSDEYYEKKSALAQSGKFMGAYIYHSSSRATAILR
jgi:hypothetical protein